MQSYDNKSRFLLSMSLKAIFLLLIASFSMNGSFLTAQTQNGAFKFWENLNTPLAKFQSTFDSLKGDSFQISFGIMSNTLFEKHIGGEGHSLYGLRLQRKSIPRDESIPRKEENWLRPLAIVDVVTATDTLLNVALGVPEEDSATKFGDFAWGEMADLRNVTAFDDHFVADQYILPLPCNHYPIYVAYWGPGEATLSLDDDFADGLDLGQVIPFLEEQKGHQEAYHGAHCMDIFKEVIFDIQTRHADIREINDFVEKLTALGFRLKVMYPVD